MKQRNIQFKQNNHDVKVPITNDSTQNNLEETNDTIESLTRTIDDLTKLLHNVTIERDKLSKDLKDTSEALKYKDLSILALQTSLEIQTDLIDYFKDRVKELESLLNK